MTIFKYSQYEEPDTAVNKHLGAGLHNHNNGEGSSSNSHNNNGRARDGSNSGSSSNVSISNTTSEEDSIHIQTIEQAIARLKQYSSGTLDALARDGSRKETRLGIVMLRSIVPRFDGSSRLFSGPRPSAPFE